MLQYFLQQDLHPQWLSTINYVIEQETLLFWQFWILGVCSLLSLSHCLVKGEDVVDLTCEGSEPAVVDLTNNDSIVVVEDGVQRRVGPCTESYVLSSDEEEESSLRLSPGLLSSLRDSSRARSTPGAISCPVCMDVYSEIMDSGRLMVSTKCGHLFCSQCIRDSLSRAHSCPTCRKKLTHKQYHPIYI